MDSMRILKLLVFFFGLGAVAAGEVWFHFHDTRPPGWSNPDIHDDRVGSLAIPNPKQTMKITGVGASNTAPNSYFEYALPSLQAGVQLSNIAINGQTFAFFDVNFATLVQPQFDPSYTANILVLQCTNDMDINDTTGAVAAASAASIANKWKALGPNNKVIIFAAWNFGGNATFIHTHIDFNNAVQAMLNGKPFDYYVDVFNIPGLNTGTTAPATDLSPDNNHLTRLALTTLVVPPYVAGVNALWKR